MPGLSTDFDAQIAYAVLVAILSGVLWGIVTSSVAYWFSFAAIVGALLSGALPGPSQATRSAGVSLVGVPVRLSLNGCIPDVDTDVGRSFSRRLSMQPEKRTTTAQKAGIFWVENASVRA